MWAPRIVCNEGFSFGNCAMLAIAQAFDMDRKSTYICAKFAGVAAPGEGLSFFECKKFINRIAEFQGKVAIYHPNKVRVTASQAAYTLGSGIFILHFSEHLSCVKNTVVYDAYFGTAEFNRLKPTGWWAIR